LAGPATDSRHSPEVPWAVIAAKHGLTTLEGVSPTPTPSVLTGPVRQRVDGPAVPFDSPPLRPAYARDAAAYDQRTAAYERFREEVVVALPLRRGDAVLDVGCGTGLCFAPLAAKVGPEGAVIGIDESPDMIALARARLAAHGWGNVSLVRAPAARLDFRDGVPPDGRPAADAAVFCAVHDVLQSPAAVGAVLAHLRPGAWVAATGGKWAAPWMVALNLQIRALHEPYVRSFAGFDRPWRHLERWLDGFQVVDVAFGAGYLAVGRVRATPTRREAAMRRPHPWAV
jgi:SAM-dependent methyltransferase